MASILLIEDDPNIRFSIELTLNDEGYRVMSCDNGADGLSAALGIKPDLVLLDLLLPEFDGRELLVELKRQCPNVPVVVLTALSDDKNKISCLDNGADDYVTKPFSIDELLARIRVCLRRSAAFGASTEATPKTQQFGDMEVNLASERVSIKGEPVYLKKKEFAILKTLLQRQGSLVKRSSLVKTVWGEGISSNSSTVDSHIYSLRKALASSEYEFIETKYGQGYCFNVTQKTK